MLSLIFEGFATSCLILDDFRSRETKSSLKVINDHDSSGKSLLVEQLLDIREEIHWVDLVMIELEVLTLIVGEELCEVPRDLTVLGSLSNVLVHRTHVVTFNFDFFENRERDGVILYDPLLYLLVWPWLLCTELVAWICKNLQSLPGKLVVHILVLTIMPIS